MTGSINSSPLDGGLIILEFAGMKSGRNIAFN